MEAKKSRLKPVLIGVALLVLVGLNINKYLGADRVDQVSRATRGAVEEINIPAALTTAQDYSFSRNVFEPIKVEAPVQEVEVPEPENKELPKEPEHNEIAAPPDIEILGTANRGGRAMALVKFQGKTYFVSAGDSLGGRYKVNKIEESNIYVSVQ